MAKEGCFCIPLFLTQDIWNAAMSRGVADSDDQATRGRVDVDGPDFDRMARLWGTSADRRRALRLIGAGVIAGSWLGRGSNITAAQTSVAQMTCTQDADCQDGDADPCTGAACQDGFCTFTIVSRIPGTNCCGNGECCPAGESGGCTADADCVPTSSDPCW
jgi:hypothetical protein